MGININNLNTSSLLKNESVSDNLQELSKEELRITGGTFQRFPVGVPVRGVPVGVGVPVVSNPFPIGFGGGANIDINVSSNSNATNTTNVTSPEPQPQPEPQPEPKFHHNP